MIKRRIILVLAIILLAYSLFGCEKKVSIEYKEEYIFQNGDEINFGKDLSYELLTKVDGVSIEGNKFVISSNVKNNTQVVVSIKNKDQVIGTVVCKLSDQFGGNENKF